MSDVNLSVYSEFKTSGLFDTFFPEI